MILMMMPRLIKKLFLLVLIFFSLITALFCEDWTIAAQKFTYSNSLDENSVNDAILELLPSQILEKLGQSIVREVHPDEKLERIRYDLRKSRLSYFLQLSTAYKKRDSIVLYDYSERTRAKKIKEQEKSINEIKKKISDNLEELKLAEENVQKDMELTQKLKSDNTDKNELEKITSLFKNLFTKDNQLITAESVKFYQNDYTKLYTPSLQNNELGYDSYDFEKAVVSANIRSLITGTVKIYGDYIAVTADTYLYPGAKNAGSITEVGTIGDIDFITSSLARSLLPLITNSMPLVLNFSIEPEEIAPNVQLYIDDVLQQSIPEDLIIDSGVHTIQLTAKNFQPVTITRYWEANIRYNVEVQMQELNNAKLKIGLLRPVIGQIYVNGEATVEDENGISHIKINGKNVLGEFLADGGGNQLFYVPQELIKDENMLSIKPYTYDKSKYIDISRKIMYGSYSLLITSLVPTFYYYGEYYNKAMLYNNGFITRETALKAQSASYISSGISIGCGVLFGASLVHYLVAANSILPQKAKKITSKKMYKLEETAQQIEELKIKKAEEEALMEQKRLEEERQKALQEEATESAEVEEETLQETEASSLDVAESENQSEKTE